MHKKIHYWELDGLRGVAAISVALFHLQWFFGGRSFFGHGYLAVDFFFMLSGFVLSHTYCEKLHAPGSFAPYMRDRLIRLYPMLFAGAAIGVVATLSGNAPLSQRLNLIVPVTLFNALGLPALWLPDPFALNVATWSLFFELVASILFGLAAPMVTKRRLLIAAGVTCGLMLLIGTVRGTFGVGWTRKMLPGGLIRVCGNFTLGMIVHQLHQRGVLANGGRRWWVAPLLVASFVALPTRAPGTVLYDPAVVFALYPFLILAAAGSRPLHIGTAKMSGALSYPFYVIHTPIFAILEVVATTCGISIGRPEATGMVAVTLLISWLLLKTYDEPLRRYLKSRNRVAFA